MLTLDCIRGLYDTINVSERVDLDETVLLPKNVGVSDGRVDDTWMLASVVYVLNPN